MASVIVSNNMSDELFLPWVESANDRRFKRILLKFVIIFVLISVVVPFIPTPKIVKKDLKTVAPRISKLVMEKKKQPPPLPEVKKKIKKKVVKKKKEIQKKEAIYKKAASSGLVALSNELTDLRENFDFPMFDAKPLKAPKIIGKQNFSKDIVTAKATQSSAGIDTSQLARSASNSKLSGRSTTKVTSSIANKAATSRTLNSKGKKVSRTENEIERVFQKNKGAIYNIYNRALRKDPTLEGKVIVELTISPNGRVVECRIISSELSAPALERKIIARIKLFKFKPSAADTVTIKYPIDFLPS